MEIGKALQNFTGSMTGRNTKAILCIRKVEQNIDQNDNNNVDALGGVKAKVAQNYDQLNQQLLEKAEQSLKGKKVQTFDTISEMALNKNYIALEVQYNPTTLRLDTLAGKQMDFKGSAANQELSLYNSSAETVLSMNLLFDDTNNMDAFMLGDNPLLGFTPSNAANVVTSSIRGDEYSVMRQMQGLLALLTIQEAQKVIFFWGNMSFHGILTDVDMQYTMFNKKGNPIRGMISLSIRQDDQRQRNQARDKLYTYDEDYWNNAFDDTFTEPGTGMGTLDKINQFTNNSFLNLKL